MSVTVSHAKTTTKLAGVAKMTRRYLEWDIGEFEKASGTSLNLKDYWSNTLGNLDDDLPPNGRLVMARDEAGPLLGLVLSKRLDESSGEIGRSVRRFRGAWSRCRSKADRTSARGSPLNWF